METPTNPHNPHCRYMKSNGNYFCPRAREALTQCKDLSISNTARQTMTILNTAGGRIQCLQCSAFSRRTKKQCRAPAIAGKTVCRFHGGKSTGPRTPEGRQRCAQARTTHGKETTSMRIARSIASAKLSVLESVGFEFGIMAGLKSRGPKPHRMAQVLPELHVLVRHLRSQKMPPA